ncbi:hypothetical protein A7O61_15415 [Listeria monocytogenes]|uniref:hypothetical protein n=1 Tax=Listeria monocytogenes TaxID=1639 RepID=UPI000BDEA937|nr:hypothetical protein [Listeria monocytogenes]PCV75555.1 hypothetical protein A7O61_15415 [Listeria monocytogenes]
MFNSLRKFLNKWKYNQGIYEERTGIEEISMPNKEDEQMTLYHTETQEEFDALMVLSHIHISEPTRRSSMSYAVIC